MFWAIIFALAIFWEISDTLKKERRVNTNGISKEGVQRTSSTTADETDYDSCVETSIKTERRYSDGTRTVTTYYKGRNADSSCNCSNPRRPEGAQEPTDEFNFDREGEPQGDRNFFQEIDFNVIGTRTGCWSPETSNTKEVERRR